MKSATIYALGLCAAVGVAPALMPAAAIAQSPAPSLSKDERAALFALQSALQTRDYAGAAAALPRAQAAARSGYGRYLASALQLRLGLETNNVPLQTSAIDAMIASGAAPAAELPSLYQNQGALALGGRRMDAAEAAFTRWTEAAPNNPEAFVALSEVKALRGKGGEAVTLLGRAIAARTATGQKAPESWYLRGLKQAFDAKMAAPALEFGRGLVAAYPSARNWRDVLLGYRDLQPQDPALRIDVMRLMRASGSLAGERDYLALATDLNAAGLTPEAKAVLDAGVSARMVDPAKAPAKDLLAALAKRVAADRRAAAALETKANADATGAGSLAAADAYLAQANYAKAADLYAAALRKGQVDTALVQSRMGMALGMAGRRAEAEAALRSVTGPRAGLAGYWLLWLGQRGPSA